ncbi:hypothetical protein [Massilia antarctica]|uniref:hypothetical protein n=1 Tax=Massilia antarctica TaxID=2765360 RepID=UPI0006BB64D1|nr:hypothetical protein [Massilia sp. H27-R4]MCY0916455.1 hypothetical protein [Massilia sp. H27-R4]
MSIMRVHYRERQRLGAADLRFEQDYRLGLGGRHGLAHHGWGIVRGLRLVAAGAGYLLTPGIAIDGYGREIVVPGPLVVDVGGLNQKLCWYVLLYYCEQAPDPCGSQPAPRIGQRPVVTVASSFAPPTALPDDLAGARAAGLGSLAPWPVLVATFGTGCNPDGRLINYARTRYAGHRAAAIRAPNGRALMQLGLTSRADFYHFLLSTADAGEALDKRIGIDRHDTVHVWRPLYISASEAAASIDIGNKLMLHITAPMPAGPGSRVWIDGQLDALLNTLTTARRATGVPSPGADAHTLLKRESATLAFQDGQLGAVRLLDAVKLTPISFASGRRRRRTSGAAPTAFSVQLEPQDARLVLKNVAPGAAGAAASPCDVARTRGSDAQSDLSALRWRPASAIEADPLMREIHAINTSLPGDPVAGTTLRIVGGAADDTDAATRVSVGAPVAGLYHAALRMDGGRRIEIRGLPGQAGEAVLTVERTVYLPPIGAKDPLLPELLMLAYIGGLRRIGNITTAVTITLSAPVAAPSVSVPGTLPSYHINVQPAPGTSFTVKRTMELVTGEDGKGDLTFRALALPPATTTLAAGVGDIALPELRRVEPQVQVMVLMLVEIGPAVRVVVSNSLLVELDQPPP